jgi:hypothetical protein
MGRSKSTFAIPPLSLEGTCAAWLHDLLKPHVTKVLVCDPCKKPPVASRAQPRPDQEAGAASPAHLPPVVKTGAFRRRSALYFAKFQLKEDAAPAQPTPGPLRNSRIGAGGMGKVQHAPRYTSEESR